MESIKLPTKGNLLKVARNEVGKNTKGPFLAKLCLDVKSLSVITKKPILEPKVIETPEIHCLL